MVAQIALRVWEEVGVRGRLEGVVGGMINGRLAQVLTIADHEGQVTERQVVSAWPGGGGTFGQGLVLMAGLRVGLLK